VVVAGVVVGTVVVAGGRDVEGSGRVVDGLVVPEGRVVVPGMEDVVVPGLGDGIAHGTRKTAEALDVESVRASTV
jgi:hypothetical protein